MGFIKTTVYIRKDYKKLFDNVAFLLNVKKNDILNEALIKHLDQLVIENDLKEKLKALES